MQQDIEVDQFFELRSVDSRGTSMGNPNNYSLELPARCLELIDGLWGDLLAIDGHTERYGGPLTTTFLLAMATPVILLPVERMLTWRDKDRNADDRPLNVGIAGCLQAAFGGAPSLSAMPFFDAAHGWSYVYTKERFNIALGLREDVAIGLGDPSAVSAAESVDAIEAVRALRNALAHGVVGFLDEAGFSTHGSISTMLAFVGEHRPEGKYAGSHVFRISEAGFRTFLREWVNWLNQSGIAQELAA